MLTTTRRRSRPRKVRKLDAARQALAIDYMHLAYKRAHYFARRYASDVPVDELIGFAMIGLVIAANHFNPKREASFMTYAFRGIKNHLVNGINSWRRWKRCQPMPTMFDGEQYDPEDAYSESAASPTETREEIAALRRYMPARWFDSLCAYHGKGQPMDTIGEAHGVSAVGAC